uniref:Choline/ethanolamine kinase n=1 Tax=Cacopsylla melanoneura TaxID=428564 RepID=A0A8D9BKV0_9HEMI
MATQLDCAEMVVEHKEVLEMALSICKGYLAGAWKRITAEDICVKRMSGGLTNMLYHVTLLQSPHSTEPSEVLLRIYGQTHGERALESIITDSVIFTLLSERKLGPTLHGVFPGGRIEEYIPARSLKSSELSDPVISLKIAEKMADIHLMQIPVIKEPTFLWDTIQRWLNTLYMKNTKVLNGPNVQNTQESWRPNNNNATDTLTNEQNKKNKILMKKVLSQDLNTEADWLKKHLLKVKSPVVFCHNDLQEGNILFKEYPEPPQHSPSHTIQDCPENASNDLVVIDFEYCSYNYRAFDIANHFVESMYDYTYKHFPHYTVRRDNYPTYVIRKAFVETYLSRMNNTTTTADQVLEEVKHFTLASHFFWALWSFVHDDNSEIPFGYWEYGLERLNTYYRLKQKLCPPGEQNAVKRKASTELD